MVIRAVLASQGWPPVPSPCLTGEITPVSKAIVTPYNAVDEDLVSLCAACLCIENFYRVISHTGSARCTDSLPHTPTFPHIYELEMPNVGQDRVTMTCRSAERLRAGHPHSGMNSQMPCGYKRTRSAWVRFYGTTGPI